MSKIIKINKDEIKNNVTHDTYINVSNIVAVEATSYNECTVLLAGDNHFLLKMSAEEFIDRADKSGGRVI